MWSFDHITRNEISARDKAGLLKCPTARQICDVATCCRNAAFEAVSRTLVAGAGTFFLHRIDATSRGEPDSDWVEERTQRIGEIYEAKYSLDILRDRAAG
jgi:hypothetical protein